MKKVITDLRTQVEKEADLKREVLQRAYEEETGGHIAPIWTRTSYTKWLEDQLIERVDNMELKNNREVWIICAVIALAGYGLFSLITDIIGWLW